MHRPERSAQRQIYRKRGLDAGNSSARLYAAAAQRSAAAKLRGSHRAQRAVDRDACKRLRLLRRFLPQHRLRELSRAAASAVLHNKQRQIAEFPACGRRSGRTDTGNRAVQVPVSQCQRIFAVCRLKRVHRLRHAPQTADASAPCHGCSVR